MDILIVFLCFIFSFCIVFACGYVSMLIIVLCEEMCNYFRDMKKKIF